MLKRAMPVLRLIFHVLFPGAPSRTSIIAIIVRNNRENRKAIVSIVEAFASTSLPGLRG